MGQFGQFWVIFGVLYPKISTGQEKLAPTGRHGWHVFATLFDTASYDEIERDKKIKFEGQLSLIGGTMGLLTGFSIISGVEILYFGAKFFVAVMKARIETFDAKGWKNDDSLV